MGGRGAALDPGSSSACRSVRTDVVFGAVGDGILATMLPALIGTETALGVVPLGTGNVWARELGLPMEPGSGRHRSTSPAGAPRRYRASERRPVPGGGDLPVSTLGSSKWSKPT